MAERGARSRSARRRSRSALKNPKTLAIVARSARVLHRGRLPLLPQPQAHHRDQGRDDHRDRAVPAASTPTSRRTFVVIVLIIARVPRRRGTSRSSRAGCRTSSRPSMEALYTICINTAGEKNGRRFFPVVMTIFTFIWIANWMALLPFFNAIGKVAAGRRRTTSTTRRCSSTRVRHRRLHQARTRRSSSSRSRSSRRSRRREHRGRGRSRDAEERGAECDELSWSTRRKRSTSSSTRASEAILRDAARAKRDARSIDASSSSRGEAAADLEADGKELGVLIPYFRSMNTDLNSPLSIAIMAMIFIEFWGITALGVFKYGAQVHQLQQPDRLLRRHPGVHRRDRAPHQLHLPALRQHARRRDPAAGDDVPGAVPGRGAVLRAGGVRRR